MKNITATTAPSGNGKFVPIENGKESWIVQQIESGEPIPGIKVENGLDSIRFANRTNKIAAALGEYNLKRSFHRKGDGSFAFFYSIKGSFEHATIHQLDLIKELLFAKFQDDYQTYFFESEPTLNRSLETKISLQHSTIYLYFEISFAKDWNPGEDFWEI